MQNGAGFKEKIQEGINHFDTRFDNLEGAIRALCYSIKEHTVATETQSQILAKMVDNKDSKLDIKYVFGLIAVVAFSVAGGRGLDSLGLILKHYLQIP